MTDILSDVRTADGPTRAALAIRILQYYPVTCLCFGPYAAFIIPQALYNGNPRVGFVIYLAVLAAISAAIIETLFLLLRPPYPTAYDRVSANSRYPHIFRVARVLILVSVVVDITSAVFGAGSIATQITGQAAASPVVALTTPLSSWKYVSVALLVSARLGGRISGRTMFKWIGVLIAAQLAITSLTAITQPIINFLSFIALATLLLGVAKPRIILLLSVVLLAAWPTVFSIRNDIREKNGVAVSEDLTAEERLRFDEQVAKVASYKVPAPLPEVIGLGEVVRFGLVPRALDRDRPLLSTGTLINDYIGGSRTSAYTFLPIGTIYFLNGPVGVVSYYAAWALVFVFLLRAGGGPGPVRLTMVFLAIVGPLGWTTTYPDAIVGYIQSFVAAAPVWFLLQRFGR